MLNAFRKLMSGFSRDRSGATATEYALIAGALALTIVAAVRVTGLETQKPFESVASELSAVER